MKIKQQQKKIFHDKKKRPTWADVLHKLSEALEK